MTDQSVFNNNNTPQGNPQQTPSTPGSYADQLASITNEDGTQKYGTVDDVLKGAKHAQEYIPQLKSQLSTAEAEIIALKAQVAQQTSLEETVSRLATPPAQTPPASQPAPTAGMTEESVQALIANSKIQDQANINEGAFSKSLVEKYGDKAEEVVTAKALEMGVTAQYLQDMARTSPHMALTLFQTAPAQPALPTTPGVSVPQGTPQAVVRPPALDLLKGNKGQVSDSFKQAQADTYLRLGVEE